MSAQRFAFTFVHAIILIQHVLVYFIASTNGKKCEVLTIPMCKNLGYNTTLMPNKLNDTTQKDAALAIDKYSPFVKAGCSPMLQLFLCSMYAPACVNGKELPPCRSVCENATARCLVLMKDFGVKLPEKMESCDLWPSKSDNKTCLFGVDSRPAEPVSGSSFTLSGQQQTSLELKDKILTTATLMNSHITWLSLERITVILMLIKNTSLTSFDLANSSLNSLKIMNTSLTGLDITNANVKSFTLTNSRITSLELKNTTMNSFMRTNSQVTLINTNGNSLDITNISLNRLTLMNTTLTSLVITNTSLNSFTLLNTTMTGLDITSSHIKSFKLINSRINSLVLKNTTVNSFTRRNSRVRIRIVRIKPKPPNVSSTTKKSFGVIIAVAKLQICAYFVLLYFINGFFA